MNVSTISYSMIKNGELRIQFTPSRGFKQGDHLSSHLFLIYAEGLSSLINRAKGWEEIKGLTIRKCGTSISHIFFIEDNIMFCKASNEDWDKVKAVLKLYENDSGQVINNHKYFIFFSFNILRNAQLALSQEVGRVICRSYDMYIGLPTLIGRSKYNTYRWIKERV